MCVQPRFVFYDGIKWPKVNTTFLTLLRIKYTLWHILQRHNGTYNFYLFTSWAPEINTPTFFPNTVNVAEHFFTTISIFTLVEYRKVPIKDRRCFQSFVSNPSLQAVNRQEILVGSFRNFCINVPVPVPVPGC
jgi:hypothetical protein